MLERRDAIFRLTSGKSPEVDRVMSELETLFMVVDFKNYTQSPTRSEVWQLEKYLYRDAKRSLGIICSRVAPSDDALASRRKVYNESGKTIIFLSDEDLLDMLDMLVKGEGPFDFIIEKITNFLQNVTP